MAKAAKKKRKLTTNEALEAVLGAKAAKRLRKLAVQIADEDAPTKKNKQRKSKKR
jgi:hypothetical protein